MSVSANDNDMSLQDWTERINKRLDVIYKELCDYEETVTAQAKDEHEKVKLLDLLAAVNEIYKTAQNMCPLSMTLKQKKEDLHEQVALMQHSMDLLKLEVQTADEKADHTIHE